VPRPVFPPANKRLGQHFLIDRNIVRKIVGAAELTAEDTVLEIGPGRGILTESLSQAARRVVAIEIDRELYGLLQARQGEWANVELICADALNYPFDTLPAGVVVANLPYYISTPLLFKFLEHRRRLSRLVLMLQNEVADRLVAKAGDAEYGVLSVMTQYAAEVKKAFKVSANCFRPRPDVGSAVVVLRPRPEEALLSPRDESRFIAVVKAAFAHRRKTLINSLRDEGYDAPTAMEAIVSMQLSSSVRAETLTLEQFMELTTRLAHRHVC
jgi:16S rRNA (adenine1518-N6/adenine1519-N6)-dimethyltransferase